MLFSIKRTDIFLSYWYFPYIVSDITIYKLVVLISVVLNILLFTSLINLFSSSKYFGFLVASFIPPALQFRLFHDPILSFYLSQQTLLLFLLLTLIFLLLFFKKNKIVFIVFSTIFYLITIFSYEVSYFYILPIIYIILCRSQSPKLLTIFKYLLPYIFVIILGFSATILIQTKSSSSYGGNYAGVKPSLDLIPAFKTFLIQSSASLPLSYHYSSHSQLFCNSFSCFVKRYQWSDLLPLFIFLTILYISTNEKIKVTELLILGFLITFSPIPLIAISKGYQSSLIAHGFGIGYMTVYLQYFGFATILGSLVIFAKRKEETKISQIIFGVTIIIFGIFALVTTQDNRMVVIKANAILNERRIILSKALKSGILSNIPFDSPIFFEDSYLYDPYPFSTDLNSWVTGYPWKSKYFVYQNIGLKYNVINGFKEFDSLPSQNKVIVELSNCPSLNKPQGTCVRLLTQTNIATKTKSDIIKKRDILYFGTTSDYYIEQAIFIYN